ncbi:hypothetical protein JCM14202_1853 [Agrilactobacillus composti DSM 18527 = JCM 14202]|nr:hypothetical protein [Agrilactobacillus composti]GAF39970.1 hypothetical protein JCM14202_1853 [Agrilactobacillus composti DSM 18527 = JCM 14202]
MAAPAITTALPGPHMGVVQAATANVTSKFNVPAGMDITLETGALQYDGPNLQNPGEAVADPNVKIDAIHVVDGKITMLKLVNTVDTWVAFSDIRMSTTSLNFVIAEPSDDGEAETLPLLTANANTVWTDSGNPAVTRTTDAGVTVKATTLVTSGGVITRALVAENGRTWYVRGADLTTDPAALNNYEDGNVASKDTSVSPKYVSGAQVYSDVNLKNPIANDVISYGTRVPVIAYVRDVNKAIVGYKLANGRYVKAELVTPNAVTYTKVYQSGTVTTKNQAVTYNYNTDGNATPTNNRIGAKQSLNYVAVLQDANGEIYAYGFRDTSINNDIPGTDGLVYVRASDVTTGAPTSDLTITVVPAGTLTVDSGKKAVKVYDDAATTKDSGATLSTDHDTWTVTRTAKDKDGKVVAYDLGNNQWVKAGDVTEHEAEKYEVSDMPKGTALYSSFRAAAIYSDPETTQANGKLNTSYDEWTAFKVAKDADGVAHAYDLGNNQWVKASDLALVKDLGGTFDANAGTPLYNRDGERTGRINTDGLYKVFAVTYIDGKQAVKLGNDNQWIIASAGDYYP